MRELATLAKMRGVRVVVHAQVHLEICRQRRVKDGEKFSPDLIDTYLKTLEIEVVDAKLDRAAAERWAELLSPRYPTEKAWKSAKLRSVKARLPDEASLPAHRIPMTTDWLIALAIEDQSAYVAVEDTGEEWNTLRATSPRRAFTFAEAIDWLGGLPETSSEPTSIPS
ncbi:MAG: hypothetical protein ACMG6S_00070 [Byssovorax sp.]